PRRRIRGAEPWSAHVSLAPPELGVAEVLENEEGNERVHEEMGRDAPEGQRRVAGDTVRGKHHEVAPVLLREIDQGLLFIRAAEDNGTDGCPLACQLITQAVQVLLGADLEALGERPRSLEVVRRVKHRGRNWVRSDPSSGTRIRFGATAPAPAGVERAMSTEPRVTARTWSAVLPRFHAAAPRSP